MIFFLVSLYKSTRVFFTAQVFLCLLPAQPYSVDSMLEVDKVKPVHCVQTTIHTLNGPFCKSSAFHQQPSCAPSLQFLFDKFNGCAAVGHACTHGHVSCQEPDDSTLALLILQTASLAALRQVVRGGRHRKE